MVAADPKLHWSVRRRKPSTLDPHLILAAAQQHSPPQMLAIMEATLLKCGSPPAQPGSASTTEGAEVAGDPVSGLLMLGRLRALLGGGGQESDSFKASCAPRPPLHRQPASSSDLRRSFKMSDFECVLW